MYLTGDKNRETLPEVLREGGLDLRSLKVYETQGSSGFEKELGDVVGGVDIGVFSFMVMFTLCWWVYEFVLIGIWATLLEGM